MFLDPDPTQRYKHSRGSRNDSMSGFFSSQRPLESPRDHRTTIRRKLLPLHERSSSDINQQNLWLSPDKPTVRLVKNTSPSPTPSAPPQTSRRDQALSHAEKEKSGNREQDSSPSLVEEASVSQPGFLESDAASQDIDVSDWGIPANQDLSVHSREGDSLLETTPTHAQRAGGPQSEWRNWRDSNRLSSVGNLSSSSTLFREGDSVFGKGEKSIARERGFSEGSTLRGITPHEEEYRALAKHEDYAAQLRPSSVSGLESVAESPEERATVRVVSLSQESVSSDHQLRSVPSQSSVVYRPQTSPRSSFDVDHEPWIPRKSWRRSSSTGFLPAPLNIRKTSASPSPASPESVAISDRTESQPSSPNFVAYGTDSPRPRSGSQPLAHSFSIESIQATVQYATVVRPETAHSLAASSSWSSLQATSADTPPPLRIPKKPLRHKQAHQSLDQAARASFDAEMADEEIDILPYPREPFTTHLSTIASESDRQSKTTSQVLSHFSLGSGVLTGDDASSILPFSSSNGRRRRSAPIESMVSEVSPIGPRTSSDEDAGDMTLDVFRQESAKPPALFQPEFHGTTRSSRNYDGPLPPIPPIPTDSDENIDTVSGLPTPSLRTKRSGYSLRGRSNSTPSRRVSESERWSNASSLFPTWAKNFYGHGAALMSASKVSLSQPPPPRNNQMHGHERNLSQWTERSITSRLGTGYTEIEAPESPQSSHFLPSIFRPGGRGRANTDGSRKLQKRRAQSKRSQPSRDDSRPDSMAILADPLPQSTEETLPSGEPKWVSLNDTIETPHPLPRKYSGQKRWDEQQYPRPMTKDRLSDFHIQNPHLAPTDRSTHRLSSWRPPSFVESLDTLWRSRCNRQILLFALGFLFPPCWLLGAILPIPRRPMTAAEYDAEKARIREGQSEEDIQAAMMKHEAGDAEKRWREEKIWLKGRWWRWLNRIMSVVGMLLIGAVVALAVVATT